MSVNEIYLETNNYSATVSDPLVISAHTPHTVQGRHSIVNAKKPNNWISMGSPSTILDEFYNVSGYRVGTNSNQPTRTEE